MCLIFQEIEAVFKKYSVKRHFDTKHNLKFDKEVKQLKIKEFKSKT